MQKFAGRGHTITMSGNQVLITNSQNSITLVADHHKQSGLFFLKTTRGPDSGMKKSNSLLLARTRVGRQPQNVTDSLWRLHLRHGHRNFIDICRQYSLPIPKILPACTSCVMGKAHIYPHLEGGFVRATRRGQGFHSDFKGPFTTETPSGHKYLLTLTDDYSRRIFGFLVKSQTEWFDIWTKFVARMEAEIGNQNCISWILSDNGAVYRASNMATFCSTKGIQQRFSAPYSQWQNGVAERNMRSIGEMAITTMVHANMPPKAWGWAVILACDVLNRTAERADANKKAGVASNFSRLEKWHGKVMPNLTKGLYPFGCLCFKLIHPELRGKMDAHATPMVYLGLDSSCKAFLLGSLYELNVSSALEVTFFEGAFPFRKLNAGSPTSLLWGAEQFMQVGDAKLGIFGSHADETAKTLDKHALKAIGAIPESYGLPEDVQAPIQSSVEAVAPAESENEPVLRRSSRQTFAPTQTNQRYRVRGAPPYSLNVAEASDANIDEDRISPDHFCVLNMLTEASLQTITPRNAHEALKSPQKDMWLAAMNREKECHIKNGTFGKEVTPTTKPVPADWVFRIKYRGGPIHIEKLNAKQFKARVVIRGQFMVEGVNFNDTFAPVAKPTTLRALLAFATKYSCSLKAGDIETAFLTADIDCETVVKLPPYWGNGEEAITGDNLSTKPRILLKGVPGIPQGSRLFYETFAAHLLTMGYTPSDADKCLFINKHIKEKHAVLIWVDDFIFMYENEPTYAEFMTGIRVKFTVPTSGPLKSFLGMEIVHDVKEKRLTMNQTSTVNVLLERSKMTDCNPVSTPCVAGFVFTKADAAVDPDPQSVTEYRSLIALANFLSCWSRPDITFTVNKLCKFMSYPGEAHWKALKHLIRYLKGSRNDGICYNFGSDSKHSLLGYTDSSFADCVDSGRSTLAYVFFYGQAILSWFSKLNTYVTTCTNHSEYCALAHGAKEAEWLVLLFKSFEPDIVHTPIPLLVDNSGVVSMVFNPISHQTNKHVRIGCHYTRELTTNKVIVPQRVPTQENVADVFTKPLPGIAYNKLTATFMQRAKKTEVVSVIVINNDPAPNNVVLMIAAHQDDSSDSDDNSAATSPASPRRANSRFQKDWPYVSTIKRELGADECEVIETEELFGTGRRKYCAIFYKITAEGKRVELERRMAMRLVNKTTNEPYMVCKSTEPPKPNYSPSTPPSQPTYSPPPRMMLPNSPPRLPVPEYSPSQKATLSSSITIVKPVPTLTCCKCKMINTPEFALLECKSCNCTAFTWSCACSTKAMPVAVAAAAAAVAVDPPAEPKQRARRSRINSRSWSEQIKYKAPIGRHTLCHRLSCPVLGPEAQVASIEFANAQKLKRAQCCFTP